jgi:hypothetical protein
MSMIRKMSFAALALAIAAGGMGLGESLSIPGIHGAVSQAQARVGRPLTPVSVAGVARRTVRRCAVGVYYC